MADELISHYRVLQRLGAGGMGEVFLAEDLRLHRQVALKMLRAGDCSDAARARLVREARVASSLNHPGIAVVYEVDEIPDGDGTRTFIAMEYISGETLTERLKRGRLPLAESLRIAWQVADALQEAHARGVVHRDVKPSNVMITEGGRVKVLDFGLATFQPLTDDGNTWSRAPHDPAAAGIVGTVSYMSPEQARGREVDARSDVFSLGVVLHELVAGRLPFTGESAVEVIDAILHQDPPPLTAEDPAAAGVHRLLRRMLAKDRGLRPQDMGEVAQALEALRRVAAGEVPPPAPPTLAVMTFDNISGNAEDDWLGTGIAETLTADLKGVEGLTVIPRERIHEVLRALEDDCCDEPLLKRVGRALGARFVLSGGFQRAGGTVRATAGITDLESGTVTHSVKVDGRVSAIFDLQDRIATELTAGLRRAVHQGAEAEGTRVVAAYEALVKGTINLRLETHETMDRAIVFFERATMLDPGYARAFLQLGNAYDLKAAYLVIPELRERAVAAYRRALELQPGLAEAWRELCGPLVALGRIEEGLEAVHKALALDPDDAPAYAALGRAHLVGTADFAAGAAAYEKAVALNPDAGWYHMQLSHCCALLRDFARGEEAARRSAALQESFVSGKDGVVIVGAHMRLGHLAALQDRHQEALAHFADEERFLQRVEHALRGRIRIELQQRIGSAQLHLGRAEQAEASFASAVAAYDERVRMGADDPFTRYYVAGVHALRGDADAALTSLEVSLKEIPRFTAARVRIEPEWEALRSDARLEELLGRYA